MLAHPTAVAHLYIARTPQCPYRDFFESFSLYQRE
jgi:hypothetical protein